MSARVVYEDIPVGIVESASISAPDNTATTENLLNGSNTPNIASLELNNFGLGEDNELEDNQPRSYVSTDESLIDCTFSTSPVITITFSEHFTTSGLTIIFTKGDWCSSIQADYYDGVTLIDTKTLSIDGEEYIGDFTETNFDKIVLTILKTSKPYTHAKIDRITFGKIRVFGMDEITAGNLVMIANPLSQTMECNKMSLKLHTIENINSTFAKRQVMTAMDGVRLLGAFYIEDARKDTKNQYSIELTDAIGLLDEDVFPATMCINENALTLAQTIVNGLCEIIMDASLQSKTINGYIPKGTRRQALHQLCFALGAIADTSGSYGIKIFEWKTATKTITKPKTYNGSYIRKEAEYTDVELVAHTYTQVATEDITDDAVVVNGLIYKHQTSVHSAHNTLATSTKTNVLHIETATLIDETIADDIVAHMLAFVQMNDTLRVKHVITDEVLGDKVLGYTEFDSLEGLVSSMTIKLSGISVSDTEVKGNAQ